MGARSNVDVDVIQEKVLDGDVVVICSDGLSTLVTDEEIGRVVLDVAPDQAVRQLVALANKRGAPDNVTAAVLKVQGPTRSLLSRLRGWWPIGAALLVLLAIAGTLAFAATTANRDQSPTPTVTAPAAAPLNISVTTPSAPALPPTPARADTTVVAPSPAAQFGRATTKGRAPLRSTPIRDETDIDANKLDDLGDGTTVTIREIRAIGTTTYENNPTWYLVDVDGTSPLKNGWVWSGNVNRDTATGSPSAVPAVSPTARGP